MIWMRGARVDPRRFDVPHRLWVHEELADQLAPIALKQGGMEQEAWLMPEMVLGVVSNRHRYRRRV